MYILTISKRYFQSGVMIDNMQNRFMQNPFDPVINVNWRAMFCVLARDILLARDVLRFRAQCFVGARCLIGARCFVGARWRVLARDI